jgi:hypothetical protein
MPFKDPEAHKAYLREYAAKNKEAAKERLRAWRLANLEKVKEQNKCYAKKHHDKLLEKTKQWKQKNIELVRKKDAKAAKKYREDNKEKVAASKLKYAQENKHIINAAVARRKAARLQRTPKWLTDFDKLKIQCIYSIAAMLTRENKEPWHVDHIIPLQGELVSGLHVPINLQPMQGVKNVSKNNFYKVLA